MISRYIISIDMIIDLVLYLKNPPTHWQKVDILKQILNKVMHISSEVYSIAKALPCGVLSLFFKVKEKKNSFS